MQCNAVLVGMQNFVLLRLDVEQSMLRYSAMLSMFICRTILLIMGFKTELYMQICFDVFLCCNAMMSMLRYSVSCSFQVKMQSLDTIPLSALYMDAMLSGLSYS